MKKNIIYSMIAFGLMLSTNATSQDSLKAYLNIGYITSIIVPEDCTQADVGGSIRIGVLNKKKLGFYVGYAWFQEYHEDFIEYDDKAKLYIAGIDYRLIKRGGFTGYLKLGLAVEDFISVYPKRTENEISLKPDFGAMIHVGHFNVYLGWQPSAPSHYNIGAGFSFYIHS